MTQPDSKFYKGHRERLRAKFLDNQLADYEKLELMLGYVVPRRDMRPLAHALLKEYGSISQILTMPYDALVAFPGVGRNIAIFLKIIHDIVVTGYQDSIVDKPIFHKIDTLKNYCKWLLSNTTIEEFYVLYLDADLRLIEPHLHSTGTCNTSGVYVREIAKHALKLNSVQIVLLHNHPSSASTFSTEDIETTECLQKTLQDLDITIYDHILVSKYSMFSARELGFIKD